MTRPSIIYCYFMVHIIFNSPLIAWQDWQETGGGSRELQSRLATTITQDSNNSHSTAVCGCLVGIILGTSNSFIDYLHTDSILLTSRGSVSSVIPDSCWMLLRCLFQSLLLVVAATTTRPLTGLRTGWGMASAGSQQLFRLHSCHKYFMPALSWVVYRPGPRPGYSLQMNWLRLWGQRHSQGYNNDNNDTLVRLSEARNPLKYQTW